MSRPSCPGTAWAVLVAAISPYRQARGRVRGAVDNFVEVHVAAPVETCARRDPRACTPRPWLAIEHFTGVSDPYEPPLAPEIVLHTEVESVDQSVQQGDGHDQDQLAPEHHQAV